MKLNNRIFLECRLNLIGEVADSSRLLALKSRPPGCFCCSAPPGKQQPPWAESHLHPCAKLHPGEVYVPSRLCIEILFEACTHFSCRVGARRERWKAANLSTAVISSSPEEADSSAPDTAVVTSCASHV